MRSLSTKGGSLARRQRRTAYLFIIPALLFFSLFFFYPLILEFQASFTTGLANPQPVGISNYQKALIDPAITHSFWITIVYAVSSLVGSAVLGLILAIILSQRIWGTTVLRTMILVPYMTSIAIVGLLWRNILDPNTGILNTILRTVGLPEQQLLNTHPLATLVAITVWQQTGYMMMLFIAGLQGIPEDYYQAAKIDGATIWQRFLHITLPLLAPTTLFVTLVGVISSLQQFGLPYIVTNGGPGNATQLLVYQVYNTTFTGGDIGYASAMSFMLLALILILSLVQIYAGRKGNAL